MARQTMESDKPAKKAKPAKAGGSHARTLILGAIFLVLVGIVAWVWTRGDDIPLEDEVVPGGSTTAPGTPAHEPLVEPDPATLPPGSTEEIRPS